LADMVGMTRAHIADPDLVSKLQQGRSKDIRPCVGANVCIRNNLEGLPIRCIHNPEAGRAAEWGSLNPAGRSKRIVVVGGGPAGLEATRVASLRGHSVELYERLDTLGGQLRLWASAPAMGELRKIIDWQQIQLEKLAVEVHTNREMTADLVAETGAEAAVIATGSRPLTHESRSGEKEVAGAANGAVAFATPHEVLEGKVGEMGKVVVWDQAGGQQAGSQIALSAAELLATSGANVQVVYPGFAVGEDVHLTMRIPLYERLLSAGATFAPNSEVSVIDGTDVVIRNIYSRRECRTQGVDLLVAWLGSQACDGLWRALEGRLQELHAVGDCLAPRSVEAAMMEGAKIARAL